ncbi:E3 ubiquitin-protein ligase RHF2A [Linum grandiflorum]
MEEEGKIAAAKMTSAAAFVEGGIQDECEDSCSICLEEFSSNDPSTLTKCRHEYHLQCILEWCQRSSDCPMCLQPVRLKDPSSQELFEAVEQERKIRTAAARNPTVLRHPTLGDFDLQHLPGGASNARLEARILQHLAAAAAMGRTHFGSRRESHRSSSSRQHRPHLLVFSNAPSSSGQVGISSSSMSRVGRESEPAAINGATPSTPLGDDSSPHHDHSSYPLRPTIRSSNERMTPSPDTPGSSESFSETLKSRLSSLSMRYRDSFSRSTRGWTDRFFTRSNSLSDIVDTRNDAGPDSSRSPSSARLNGTNTGSQLNGGDSPPSAAATSATT